MKGESLPPTDHVARHCSRTQCDSGVVQGSAFLRRESEPALSVCWLERTGHHDRDSQLRTIVEELRAARDVRDNSYIAVLKVETAIDRVSQGTSPQVLLSAIHWPNERIPTHSRLQGMDVNALIVGEILAEVANLERPRLVSDITAT